MTKEDIILEFLSQVGVVYGDRANESIYGLLLKHGRNFPLEGASLLTGMPPKACFDNAYYRATHSSGRWIYCEGFAIANIGVDLPLEHAWCIDAKTSALIEMTWPEIGLAYWGVAFTIDAIRDRRYNYREDSSILFGYGGIRRLAESGDFTKLLHPIQKPEMK